MSLESAKAFLERMKNDEEFAQKIITETTAESRMALTHGENFHFTAEEIAQATRELTDDELDAILGSFNPLC